MKLSAICRSVALLIPGIPMLVRGQEISRDSALDSAIHAALNRQLELHPYSHYRDVYKNFMQDHFGPGHILTDTAAAANYLRQELAINDEFGGPMYEPTGCEGNFYRVNLSLIRDGYVSFNIFFDAFLSSVAGITPADAESWKERWAEIDRVISDSGIRFENEDIERQEIAEGFSNGRFIFHHTRQFNDQSRYHYRIISRENFLNKILPLLLEN